MARNRNAAFVKYKTFNILNPIQNSTKDGVFKMSINSMEKYKANLYTLLFTGIGQRVMMPTFGTRIMQIIFEPLGENSYSEIDNEIREKVEYWIPDIEIIEILFGDKESDLENNSINMKISFALKADETIQDFVEIEMGT